MSFRLLGLPIREFQPFFGMSDAELKSRRALRLVGDETGLPCRVTLEDAGPGEPVILLNYTHLPAANPFRSSHAIFVRQGARETYDRRGEVPDALRGALLSMRAFDADHMMIDADVVPGGDAEALIERLLDAPAAAYLHVHYARRGCYAARVERA